MDDNILEIFFIESITNVEESYSMKYSNESVAYIYPKLYSSRTELIPYENMIIHIRVSEVLSDAEVQNICESLSLKTFYELIKHKLQIGGY